MGSVIQYKDLSRQITIIENELDGYEEILSQLNTSVGAKVIGITGPPGAGKSTLLNALISELCIKHKVAVIAVDPSSPFSHGALLGDRLRMMQHHNNSNVYIRSLATRGVLGGLSAKTMEVADLCRNAGFDYVFIETVGVGQSEMEIVSLADVTVLVLVPESGDDIQAMKAGIMEAADMYVINKHDRDGADRLFLHLSNLLQMHHKPATILKTSAINNEGILQLLSMIEKALENPNENTLLDKVYLRVMHLLYGQCRKKINSLDFRHQLEEEIKSGNFNIHKFVKNIRF
ncbi:MAG: methylmalonyl Co-A mutase-associated GTPase MeaB [Bacteroidetes bacterium]|nr:methylmalonyl Co-A mutase-associated GTPase MeaB [Bacteroidota bacterium]